MVAVETQFCFIFNCFLSLLRSKHTGQVLMLRPDASCSNSRCNPVCAGQGLRVLVINIVSRHVQDATQTRALESVELLFLAVPFPPVSVCET